MPRIPSSRREDSPGADYQADIGTEKVRRTQTFRRYRLLRSSFPLVVTGMMLLTVGCVLQAASIPEPTRAGNATARSRAGPGRSLQQEPCTRIVLGQDAWDIKPLSKNVIAFFQSEEPQIFSFNKTLPGMLVFLSVSESSAAGESHQVYSNKTLAAYGTTMYTITHTVFANRSHKAFSYTYKYGLSRGGIDVLETMEHRKVTTFRPANLTITTTARQGIEWSRRDKTIYVLSAIQDQDVTITCSTGNKKVLKLLWNGRQVPLNISHAAIPTGLDIRSIVVTSNPPRTKQLVLHLRTMPYGTLQCQTGNGKALAVVSVKFSRRYHLEQGKWKTLATKETRVFIAGENGSIICQLSIKRQGLGYFVMKHGGDTLARTFINQFRRNANISHQLWNVSQANAGVYKCQHRRILNYQITVYVLQLPVMNISINGRVVHMQQPSKSSSITEYYILPDNGTSVTISCHSPQADYIPSLWWAEPAANMTQAKPQYQGQDNTVIIILDERNLSRDNRYECRVGKGQETRMIHGSVQLRRARNATARAGPGRSLQQEPCTRIVLGQDAWDIKPLSKNLIAFFQSEVPQIFSFNKTLSGALVVMSVLESSAAGKSHIVYSNKTLAANGTTMYTITHTVFANRSHKAFNYTYKYGLPPVGEHAREIIEYRKVTTLRPANLTITTTARQGIEWSRRDKTIYVLSAIQDQDVTITCSTGNKKVLKLLWNGRQVPLNISHAAIPTGLDIRSIVVTSSPPRTKQLVLHLRTMPYGTLQCQTGNGKALAVVTVKFSRRYRLEQGKWKTLAMKRKTRVFIAGENSSIICHLSLTRLGLGDFLMKHGDDILAQTFINQFRRAASISHQLWNVSQANAGVYTCQYRPYIGYQILNYQITVYVLQLPVMNISINGRVVHMQQPSKSSTITEYYILPDNGTSVTISCHSPQADYIPSLWWAEPAANMTQAKPQYQGQDNTVITILDERNLSRDNRYECRVGKDEETRMIHGSVQLRRGSGAWIRVSKKLPPVLKEPIQLVRLDVGGIPPPAIMVIFPQHLQNLTSSGTLLLQPHSTGPAVIEIDDTRSITFAYIPQWDNRASVLTLNVSSKNDALQEASMLAGDYSFTLSNDVFSTRENQVNVTITEDQVATIKEEIEVNQTVQMLLSELNLTCSLAKPPASQIRWKWYRTGKDSRASTKDLFIVDRELMEDLRQTNTSIVCEGTWLEWNGKERSASQEALSASTMLEIDEGPVNLEKRQTDEENQTSVECIFSSSYPSQPHKWQWKAIEEQEDSDMTNETTSSSKIISRNGTFESVPNERTCKVTWLTWNGLRSKSLVAHMNVPSIKKHQVATIKEEIEVNQTVQMLPKVTARPSASKSKSPTNSGLVIGLITGAVLAALLVILLVIKLLMFPKQPKPQPPIVDRVQPTKLHILRMDMFGEGESSWVYRTEIFIPDRTGGRGQTVIAALVRAKDSGPTTRLEPTSTSSDSLQPATSDTWAYDEPLTDSYPRESLKHHWSIIRELHANGGQGHKNVIRLLQEYDSLMMSGDEFLGNIILEFAAQGTLLSFLQKQATIKRPCCNYINCRCQASERNLRTRSGMGRTPQLSLATYCNYADQILEGLKYLRKCQVIHGDVSPQNILITSDGTLKLCDFGHSVSPTVQGMPSHMPWKHAAIECLQKPRQIVPQSDVWSFGVVLWQMSMLGEEPYEDINKFDILEFLQHGGRLPCPELHVQCPEELYDIMTKCWKEDWQDRPMYETLQDNFRSLVELHCNPVQLGCCLGSSGGYISFTRSNDDSNYDDNDDDDDDECSDVTSTGAEVDGVSPPDGVTVQDAKNTHLDSRASSLNINPATGSDSIYELSPENETRKDLSLTTGFGKTTAEALHSQLEMYSTTSLNQQMSSATSPTQQMYSAVPPSQQVHSDTPLNQQPCSAVSSTKQVYNTLPVNEEI